MTAKIFLLSSTISYRVFPRFRSHILERFIDRQLALFHHNLNQVLRLPTSPILHSLKTGYQEHN